MEAAAQDAFCGWSIFRFPEAELKKGQASRQLGSLQSVTAKFHCLFSSSFTSKLPHFKDPSPFAVSKQSSASNSGQPNAKAVSVEDG